MEDFTIYTDTAREKYAVMDIIRAAGAHVCDVCGCAPGYLVSFTATCTQLGQIGPSWDTWLDQHEGEV